VYKSHSLFEQDRAHPKLRSAHRCKASTLHTHTPFTPHPTPTHPTRYTPSFAARPAVERARCTHTLPSPHTLRPHTLHPTVTPYAHGRTPFSLSLWSECDTSKPVKPSFWPCISGERLLRRCRIQNRAQPKPRSLVRCEAKTGISKPAKARFWT